MPDSMIERAGKAILAKVPQGYGMTPAEANEYARAAFVVVRELDEAQIDAAMSPEYGDDLPTTKRGWCTIGGMIVAQHRAIIDQILKDSP